ncbi:tail terminator [Gordonia phage SteamedHams]|nr:tail terminator [Gordonia phage SteamedHams]QWY82438.1 tail terminator [Gordonia phage Tolls]
MLGVSEHEPLPPVLLSMIGLLRELNPGLSVSQDRPKSRPQSFIVVDLVGGSEDVTGTLTEPVFAIQCYATNTGDAESLCGLVLAQCKSSQFTLRGDTQFRGWRTESVPYPFPDPLVADRRRWQFTGAFGISNRKKG